MLTHSVVASVCSQLEAVLKVHYVCVLRYGGEYCLVFWVYVLPKSLRDEQFRIVLIFLMPYGFSSVTQGIIYGLAYRGFHSRQGQDTTVLTDLEVRLVSYAMCPVDAFACSTMVSHNITVLMSSHLVPKYGICRTVLVFSWYAVVTWCLRRRVTTLFVSGLKINKFPFSQVAMVFFFILRFHKWLVLFIIDFKCPTIYGRN